jgi:hypothetical protein
MFADDKSRLIPEFRYQMTKLDAVRNEDIRIAIPELTELMDGDDGLQL